MKLISLLSLLIIITSNLFGRDTNCYNIIQPNGTSVIEKTITDCKVQKEFANKNEVKTNHKEEIYKRLAEKLATQINQNSEELSLLTNFYKSNHEDLLMNNSEVAKTCKLGSINKIETCAGVKDFSGNSKLEELRNTKLKILIASLPQNKNSPFDNTTLFGRMAGKFYSDLGLKSQGNEKQCPISGSSGMFALQSQLDDFSANDIYEKLSKKNNNYTIEALFNQYAQLKIIKDSKNSNLIAEFKNFIRTKPADVTAQKRISDFFFKENKYESLIPALITKCQAINKNISNFLCTDMDELATLNNDISRDLFSGLETDKPLNDQAVNYQKDNSILIAYGMQCLAKEKYQSSINNGKEVELPLDKLYKDFTNNTRFTNDESDSNDAVDQFCSKYTCQNAQAKNTNSCKEKGVLSSFDLDKAWGCNTKKSSTQSPRTEQCTPSILKYISFIENLESLKKDAMISYDIISNSLSSSEKNKTNARLPSFAENYLGAEGSLKALGIPINETTIAEKNRDITEKTPAIKGIDQSTSIANKAIASTIKNNSQQEDMAQLQEQKTTTTPTAFQVHEFDTSNKATENTKRSVNAAISDKSSAPKSLSSASNETESSRLRSQLEDLAKGLKDIKGGDESATATTAQTSQQFAANYNSQAKIDAANALEQNRLDQKANSLQAESDNLQRVRRELDDRDYTAKSMNTNSKNSDESVATAGSANGTSHASGGGDGGSGKESSGSGASGGNSLSLTKTSSGGATAKIDQKNTAAIIQSGKELSVVTAEELTTLSPESLQNLGIDSSKPFSLKVNYQAKTYMVPVKAMLYKGDKILVPTLDMQNNDLNKFLLNSPLFQQYRDYKVSQQLKQQNAM